MVLGTVFQKGWNVVPFMSRWGMAKPSRTTERREDALSPERILDAAVEILDADGEDALTFRALAARLETGAGAIYWHISNKAALLLAASDAIVVRALAGVAPSNTPQDAIRGIAVAVFETIDAHPWVGTQLSLTPWKTAMLQIFERIGRQLQALGVRRAAQFTAASTLVSYIIGVSVQNAANGRRASEVNRVDRAEFLDTMAGEWMKLDPREYPFTRNAAAQLREHDDLAEFLGGIDLIVAGIVASR